MSEIIVTVYNEDINVGVEETIETVTIVITENAGGAVDVPIETISANGVSLPIVDKNVDVTIPTKTSDLTNDSDFQTTTETVQAIEDYASPIIHTHAGQVINPDAINITKVYTDAEIAALQTNTLFWDDAKQTYSFKTADGGTIQINQEPHDYYSNLEGAQIIEMDVVSSCGASGNRTAICLTDATDNTKSRNCIGMVTVTSIGANQIGRITKSGGKVNKINTNVSGWVEGDVLWVDPMNKGKLTNVEPGAGYNKIQVGILAVKHSVNGVIELQIRVESKLSTLADVDGTDTTITDTDEVLKKDTAGLWKKVTWANVKTLLKNYIIGLANTWSLRQLFSSGFDSDGMINHKVGEYFYTAASKTADTVNDTRVINTAGVEIHSVCTANGATKGGGTWVELVRHFYSGGIPRLKISGTELAQDSSFMYFLTTAFFGYYFDKLIRTDGQLQVGSSGAKFLATSNGDTHTFRYSYQSASPTADTVNDIRTFNNAGVFTIQKCTVASATKGGGTWVTTFTA